MQLLAKSTPPGGEPKLLIDHTLDVVGAGEILFGVAAKPTRLGVAWLRFFRLQSEDWSAFHANLLAASLFHDWGKANEGMQGILSGGQNGQLFRHEHLSVLWLGYDGVDRWVRQRNDIDWDVVLAAVGSHHLKFGDQDFAEGVEGEATQLFWNHEDFQKGLIPLAADRLGLKGVPEFPVQLYWGFVDERSVFDPSALRDHLKNKRLRKLTQVCFNESHPQARMLRAVRAALIVADAAGSGLPRTNRPIADWIREQFDESNLNDATTVWALIQKRIDDLSKQNKWQDWNDFQKQCDGLSNRALLLAPCGSGKTLGAWRWIASRVKNYPVSRVLFLYPTRATATEGFKDYVSWAPETDASLLHGTAEYDLDGMFPAEDPRSKRIDRSDPRLFALRFWSKRVFSATIDQFLAFMNYGYGQMCLLPLLADSVVVIDEVHSFDRPMFSALLGFLQEFDVPVLCMTATLQKPRQDQLVSAGLQLANPRPNDLKKIADAERYRVMRIAEEAVVDHIKQAVKKGKRVLWVVNQVSRAQEKLQSLAVDLNLSMREQVRVIGPEQVPLICYHSRFMLDDRVDRHREVLTAIRAGESAAIAITTQVCEMSLDIDADLLVTEECPITSLIQRFGRCRRGRGELAGKGPGEVLVYKPSKEVVYKPEDLKGVVEFLEFVAKKAAVGQSDLEAGLENFGPKDVDPAKLTSFLASGSYAMGREDSFREMNDFNVSAVLDHDVDHFLSSPKRQQPGFVLPVPKKLKPGPDSRLPRHLVVADGRHYHTATGLWDTTLR